MTFPLPPEFGMTTNGQPTEQPQETPTPTPSVFDQLRADLNAGKLGEQPTPPSDEIVLPPELADAIEPTIEPTADELDAALAGDDAPPADGGEGDGEVFEFELPAMAEGQEALKLEIGDPAVAERIAELVQTADANSATAALTMQEAESALAERDSFIQALRADPAGTIRGMLDDAGLLQDFLLEMLNGDATVRDAVVEKLSQFEDDPKERELWMTRKEGQASKRKEAATEYIEEQRFQRNWNREVLASVHKLIPGHFDREARTTAMQDAMADLQRAIKQNDGYFFDPAEVPSKLAARVKLWGVTPKPAASQPSSTTTPQTPAGGRSSAPAPAGAPTPEQIKAARDVPGAVKKAVAVARVRKVIAPSGQGAIPASAQGFDPGKAKNSREAVAALRSRLGAK